MDAALRLGGFHITYRIILRGGFRQKDSLFVYREIHKEGEDHVADKQEWIVEGYLFGSPTDAEQARTERKKALYVEAKLEGKPVGSVLAVYEKMLEEKVFVTPVGWEYLKQIQEKLRLLGAREEEIKPIPLFSAFVHKEERKNTRPRIEKPKEKIPYQNRFRSSVVINILLVILVLAMFFIASGSDNPNIINYRNAIVNEFASWEQDLTQREKEVRLREAELGIEGGALEEGEEGEEEN